MKFFASLAALLCASITFLPHANAQDYVAISVEAEDFSQKNSLWRVFSSSSTPNVNPDPDGSHHTSASGRAYVELLPDTRVTHSDPLATGRNFWNQPGTGPSLSYIVNIPEAGRYIVFAKSYSTGTEDNGIHVGLNSSNPASGERMQWCSGKNQWTWSSAQRQSNNHCGVPRTIYLDIPSAGANTIVFSAREDGFELDKFILLKENVAGLNCSPGGNDQITCNGSANGTVTNGGTPATVQPVAVVEPVVVAPVVVAPVVVAPTEVPAVTPVATTPASITTCSANTLDSDGDGYGYENGQSCLMSVTNNSPVTAQNNAGTVPACTSGESDSDGDGWGWENNRSCRISANGSASSTTELADFPTCAQESSDSDQDGWGWENSRSCIVR